MAMQKTGGLILLLVVLIVLGNFFLPDDAADKDQALRCEMFQIWVDSNGEYGWPPESNLAAADQCGLLIEDDE